MTKKRIAAVALALVAVAGLGGYSAGQVAESKKPVIQSKQLQLLDQTSKAFHEIAQRATPAVVSISVVKKAQDPMQLLGLAPPGSGSPDEAPPGGGVLPGPGGPAGPGGPGSMGGPAGRSMGLGSGIIIRPDGYIATNNHVVEGAEKITVTLGEKNKYNATLIGTDPKTDIAVIRVERTGKDANQPLPALSFGTSDDVRVGDWAVAIGTPFGLSRSVSSGIISAKGRAQMGILDIEDFIQTDAAINPGSSGGPLLNAQGELIGLNTAIFTEGGGFMGIGFAIPAEIAHEITDQLIDRGYVTRGYLGLSAQDMDDDLAKYFKTPNQSQGALVSDVAHGSPAFKASLEPGDVVLTYDEKKVESSSQFKNLVGRTPIGKRVAINVLRSGQSVTAQATIIQQPDAVLPPQPQKAQMAGKVGKGTPGLGLAVDDVPAEISHFLGMDPATGTGAIVVEVNPGSPAFESGIGPGDIILKMGRTSVEDARQFRQMTKKVTPGEVSVFYVQRGPHERIFVPVKNVS